MGGDSSIIAMPESPSVLFDHKKNWNFQIRKFPGGILSTKLAGFAWVIVTTHERKRMETSTKRLYLSLLEAKLEDAEEGLETLETYITEQNFDEFFEMYVFLDTQISQLRSLIKRCRKDLKKPQLKFSDFTIA